MGVKSTTCLSRKEAEEMLIEKIAYNYVEDMVRGMSDETIEEMLEIDMAFDNYQIVANINSDFYEEENS